MQMLRVRGPKSLGARASIYGAIREAVSPA